jgi:organic radical activating enzyme
MSEIHLASMPFISFQGEGAYIGRRMLFVRFFGCNLKCRYCDTRYAWASDFSPIRIDVEELARLILRFSHTYKIKDILFTGGEPGLYETHIASIIYEYPPSSSGIKYHIETNGTFSFSKLKNLKGVFFSISPKITTMLKPKKKLEELKILENLDSISYIMKFVVSVRTIKEDFEIIEKFITKNYIPRDKVYIMPFGYNKKRVLQDSSYILEQAIKQGFNFSPRLHIILYGNKRDI